MRLNLASDLKTRTGAPETKDARLKNCYVEMKGNDPAQAGVRKRPIAQGGVQVGSGIAQGGCGLVVVYGDTLYPIPVGTTCNGATLYQVGDKVTVNFVDYWATTAHVGNCPTGPGNADWSTSFVPAVPAFWQLAYSVTYDGKLVTITSPVFTSKSLLLTWLNTPANLSINSLFDGYGNLVYTGTGPYTTTAVNDANLIPHTITPATVTSYLPNHCYGGYAFNTFIDAGGDNISFTINYVVTAIVDAGFAPHAGSTPTTGYVYTYVPPLYAVQTSYTTSVKL